MINRVVVGSSDRKLLQAVSGLQSPGPECLSVNNSKEMGSGTLLDPLGTNKDSNTLIHTHTGK